MTQFTKNLLTFMDQYELTIRQAAQIAGVSSSTLQNWRAGHSPKDFEAVKRLAEFFNVSLCYLLTGKAEVSKYYYDNTNKHEIRLEGYAHIVIYQNNK